MERWAFKTNALGWFATVPNITAEVDLSKSLYNRATFQLTAKYNWDTKHTVLPYYIFNYAQLRPEFRYYWKTENVKWMSKIVKNPKNQRRNYLGLYVDGGSYTFKISEYGRQGYMCGGGLSFGYGLPMYEYRKGAIDIELGFALGVMFATTDIFILNELDNRYDVVDEKCKPLHIIPSPVVSELSLTLAWRKTSVKEKYGRINQARIQAKLARQDSLYMAQQAKEEAKLLKAEQKAQAKIDAENEKQMKAQEKLDKKAAKEAEKLNRKSGKEEEAAEETTEATTEAATEETMTETKPDKNKPKKEKKEKKVKEDKPEKEKKDKKEENAEEE